MYVSVRSIHVAEIAFHDVPQVLYEHHVVQCQQFHDALQVLRLDAATISETLTTFGCARIQQNADRHLSRDLSVILVTQAKPYLVFAQLIYARHAKPFLKRIYYALHHLLPDLFLARHGLV